MWRGFNRAASGFSVLIKSKAYMNTNLTFGAAIEALKEGKKVARIGWNGKKMFLWLNRGVLPAETVELSEEDAAATLADTEAAITQVEGVSIALYDGSETAETVVIPNINMRAATGATVTGWLASQTDMLAEDWTIVE